MSLSDSLQRTLFKPSLRMIRRLTGGKFDHLKMRRGVARIERMLDRKRVPLATTPVTLAQCSAHWIDVNAVQSPRVILYFHGGGFVFETPTLHSALLANLCRLADSRGLMVNYRLAPEHPYPAATEDCLDAYRYLLGEGYRPEQIIIAGDSAGGNLTLVTLLRIRACGLPLPAGAIALSPLTDATGSSDSMRRNARHDPMFDTAAYDAVVPLYLPDAAQRGEPWASPINGDLAGLPPIHLFVGSSEILLDDAVRYAIKCPSATLEVWHNMPHVFPMFDFLPEARDAQQRIARHILTLFGDSTKTVVPEPGADQLSRSAPARGPLSSADPGSARSMPPDTAHRRSHTVLGIVYGGLALLGLVANVDGLALTTLLSGLSAMNGAIVGHFVLLCASLVFIATNGAQHVPQRMRWSCLGITLLFGSACGLPLFLFLREQRRA